MVLLYKVCSVVAGVALYLWRGSVNFHYLTFAIVLQLHDHFREWYVEKLHMERKNIVILVDNSVKPVGPTDVMSEAMTKIFNTLTPSDKVRIRSSRILIFHKH
jgi:hypothetical protein